MPASSSQHLPTHAADLARLAVAIQTDLQKGSPHEVRAKALQALAVLPGHRLEGLLTNGKVLERLVSGGGVCFAAALGRCCTASGSCRGWRCMCFGADVVLCLMYHDSMFSHT